MDDLLLSCETFPAAQIPRKRDSIREVDHTWKHSPNILKNRQLRHITPEENAKRSLVPFPDFSEESGGAWPGGPAGGVVRNRETDMPLF